MIFNTMIGVMDLDTDWPALQKLVALRACGYDPIDRTYEVRVYRRPALEVENLPEDWGLKVLDARAKIERGSIHMLVPDPSFSAGIVLDWLWLAIGRFCAPERWPLLHAAAITEGDGVTLIVGPSGSGKTTVLLEFLANGAQFLSDDAVLLDPEDGMVRPWAADLHLLPEQLVRFPHISERTLDFNGKVRVSPQSLSYSASMGGILKRTIVLAEEGQMVPIHHDGVGMETPGMDTEYWEALHRLAPVEFWNYRSPDAALRIRREHSVVCPSFAVCTPFSGKEWALERWLESFHAMNIPKHASIRWLCNSSDDIFWNTLKEQASLLAQDYPDTVCWRDTSSVGLKDRQVAYLWQQIRTRVPDESIFILTLEDDVLPDPEAFEALLSTWAMHGGKDIVGLPVPHTYQYGEVTALAWDYERTSKGVQCGLNIRVLEARRQEVPTSVGGLSFSCTMIPSYLFRQATLSHGYDNYPASGYDHLFCHEAKARGADIIALWPVGSTHLKSDATMPDVRMEKRRVLVLGDGEYIQDGPTWSVVGGMSSSNIGESLNSFVGAAPDYVLFTDPGIRIPTGYVDAGIEHFCWNYAFGSVWGYRVTEGGRLTWGTGPGMMVRFDACRGFIGRTIQELREHIVRNGWREGHHDRACYTVLDPKIRGEGYVRVSDPIRERSPYIVCALNRNPYHGPHPGFGGDLVQIEGYRSGLRRLGVVVDVRPSNYGEFDGYKIVHLHHTQYPWAHQQAAWCDGRLPVVCSTITHGHPDYSMIEPVVKVSDALVCYSRVEAAFYAERFPEKQIYVVPMGVWPEVFRDPIFEPEPRWDEPSVLMAGKFCAHKNQIAVLEACMKLDVPVTFCGFNEDPFYDEYPERLKDMADAYPKATVLGKLNGEALWNEYRTAHVHVCATRFEPFGQVTLDALALGCNIVHPKESWSAEQFSTVGTICDSMSVESIKDSIDQELRRRRGWANVRPPTWTEAAKCMLSVYDEVLSR